MRRPAVFAGLSFVLLLPSFAMAGDWKTTLAADRVQVANGKMTMEEFSICKSTIPGATKSVQMRNYAEVPVNAGISRDFFVSFQSATQTLMVLTMGSAAAKGTTVDPMKVLDCDPISAPIGKVDIEINLYMTADGFQLAIVDGSTGKTSQSSTRWEDALGSK